MFYLFLLAYLAADFIFLPKKTAEIKNFLLHFIISIVLNSLAVLIFILINGFENGIIIAFAIITIIHFVIDYLKYLNSKNPRVEENNKNKLDIYFLLVVMLVNIAVIAASCMIFSNNAFNLNEDFIKDLAIILIGLIFSTTVSSIFINKIFRLLSIKSPVTEENSIKDYGTVTGIIERATAFIAFIFAIYQIAVVIYAIKAIIRFDEYKKGSQYYILGNLLSIMFMVSSYCIYCLLLQI